MTAHTPRRLPLRFRTIWVSDLHLGTKRSQTAAFLDMLRHCECETLYLVGDIVDNWALTRKWYWDQAHNDILQKILRKARKGTKIVFIPGNHDEFFRDFLNINLGNILVRREAMHTTARGKRYLVLHGDKFDGVVVHARWLAHLGDEAYDWAILVSQGINRIRRMLRLTPWSLSAYLKRKVKRAVVFVSNFEHAVAREAAARNTHGVICGHVHTPSDRMIDGIHYINDGDWVESCSLLAEDFAGNLKILHWDELEQEIAALMAAPAEMPALTN